MVVPSGGRIVVVSGRDSASRVPSNERPGGWRVSTEERTESCAHC